MTSLTRLVETDAHEGPSTSPTSALVLHDTARPDVRDQAPRARHGRRHDRPGRRERGQRDGARRRRPAARLRAGHAARRSRASTRPPGERRDARRRLDGLPLNSPNDVVVTRDGADLVHRSQLRPPAGLPAPRRELGDARLPLRPGRRADVVADGFDKPNGLAFSPDERVLYVGDNGAPRRILRLRRRRRPRAWRTAASSRTARPASRTASRSTPPGASTPRRPTACASSTRRATLLGEIDAARRRQLHLRRARPRRPVHHRRRRDLGRRPSTSKEPDHMAIVRTRRIIDDAGADAVLAAAERAAHEQRPPRRDRRRRPVGRAGRAAPHAGRPDRQLARRRRQGAHRRDLRAPEPRDGGAGDAAAASARSRCTAPPRLTGGIPLTVDGEVVGAIGTSGETPDEDEAISIAGAAADFSVAEVPALTYEGARARRRGGRRRGRAARRRPGGLRRRRRRRADVPRAGPTRAQVASVEVDDRQGAHGGDLPPAEQGLRGPGLGRPARRRCTSPAPCRSRAACRSSTTAHVIGAIGVSGATVGRRGPRARRDRRGAPRGSRRRRPRTGDGASFFPAAAVVEQVRAGRPPARRPSGYKIDAGRRDGAGRGRVPRARGRRDARRARARATVVTGGEMRDAREVAPGELRAPRSMAASARAARGRRARDPERRAAPVRRRLRPVPLLRREGGGVTMASTTHRRRRPRASPARPSCCPGARTRSSTCRPTRAPRSSAAQWRYADARVEEIDFVELAGPARRPARPRRRARTAPTTSCRTREAADFDDSGWQRARARGHDAPAVDGPRVLQLVPDRR